MIQKLNTPIMAHDGKIGIIRNNGLVLSENNENATSAINQIASPEINTVVISNNTGSRLAMTSGKWGYGEVNQCVALTGQNGWLSSVISTTSATSATILAADSTKRTFITGILISWQTDAACDSTSCTITCRPRGETAVKDIVRLSKITTTAVDRQIYVPFTTPLELDKASSGVTYTCAFTAGVSSLTMIIHGFRELGA